MIAIWGIGMLCAALSNGGNVSDAALVGDRSGWRMEFECDQEPLSRVWQPQSGIVRVELKNFRIAAMQRAFGDNPWFSSVTSVPGENAVYDFHLRQGVVLPESWSRTWDGRHFCVFLSRAPAARAYLEDIRVLAGGSREEHPEAASLKRGEDAVLLSADLASCQNQESLELRFDRPLQKSSLHLSRDGKAIEVLLEGGRVENSKMGAPHGEGWNVERLSSARSGAASVLRIEVAKPLRSLALNGMGNVLELRMVRFDNVEGMRTWSAGKTESFGGSAVPSDELQSTGRPKLEAGRRTFSPASSASGALASVDAAGQDKAVRDVEILENERRKSQEFALKQKLEVDARISREEEKNRIVYHTFGVRDPFIPLDPGDAENGLNIDQMKVVGIIFSKSKRMVVLEHVTQAGLSVALKEGDPIQNGRVLRIEKERVVFLLEEFGQSREFALRLQTPKGDRT